jgi:hypothetical protein
MDESFLGLGCSLLAFGFSLLAFRCSLFAFGFWLFAFGCSLGAGYEFAFLIMNAFVTGALPPLLGSNRIIGLRKISPQSLEREGLRGKVLILLLLGI